MSRLYGSLQGNRGLATRCGTDEMRSSCQSYQGSVITRMYYPKDQDQPTVSIEISDCSSSYGSTIFSGTLQELKDKLRS